MPSSLLKWALLLALAYLGLCVLVFVKQRGLIYFPQPRALQSAPAISMAVDGAELQITVRPLKSAKALVYFGGNAEDVSHNLPDLSRAFPEHAIYLLHYRGYGDSTGRPSEAALYADALALFDRLVVQHPYITVLGRSLGSGVAVYLASQRKVERMILVTPYDSLEELAQRQFPFLPVSWLLRDKFESWKYASQVEAPTLVIAAEHDEVIPASSTKKLFGHFPRGVAEFRLVAGASHNTISDSADYWQLLRSWR